MLGSLLFIMYINDTPNYVEIYAENNEECRVDITHDISKINVQKLIN